MRFRVYQLRRNGRRLGWREVKSGPSYVGDVVSASTTYKAGVICWISLSGGGGPQVKPISDLYEPVLLTLAPHALRLRGFERIEKDGQELGVVQEWYCVPPDGSA